MSLNECPELEESESPRSLNGGKGCKSGITESTPLPSEGILKSEYSIPPIVVETKFLSEDDNAA